tara:strand:+ start:88 stop:630 length:543 start_codon:yes stop_codon:yes gene_type:complete
MGDTEQVSDPELQERLADEGYAANPSIISEIDDEVDSDPESTRDINEGTQDGRVIGYLSNEIYEPVKKYVNEVKKDTDDSSKGKNIMELSINEIIENTAQCLNDFDSEYLAMLYKADLKYGYSKGQEGFFTNMKRYTIAFLMYLNDKNNILYIGITLFIISIIIYFINIIRHDKLPTNKP